MIVEPSPELVRTVGQFPRARVLVVGDALVDEWIEGTCSSVSREAPVPTVDVGRRDLAPGGAANTAANVASLGGHATLLGVLGGDRPGHFLRELLHRRGVDTEGSVTATGRATRTKCRLLAGRQVVARFDEGDISRLPAEVDAELADRIEQRAAAADVVVVADYAGGTLAGPACREVLARVARGRPVLVDAHDPAAWREVHPAVSTPNWVEVGRVLGGWAGPRAPSGRVDAVMAARQRLLSRTGADVVVATLDCEGAVVVPRAAAPRHVATRPLADPHPAGAGDTFAAALALGLATGTDLVRAVEVAVAAGTVAAQRPRTATCSAADLVPERMSALMSPEQLVRRCSEHRVAGRRVALVNGCFDVLHAGHLACLETAAGSAEVVVVALNDDDGVRQVKGEGRPLNPLADRAAILAALGPVDHIVSFAEPAPLALIEALRPDVYVKGADHDVDALPEARLVRQQGGRVVVVPLLPDRSTTGLIAAAAALPGGAG